VVLSVVSLTATSLAFKVDPHIAIDIDGSGVTSDLDLLAGILFWIVIGLIASALPVKMPRGMVVAVSSAPIFAAMALGGPAVVGWVALIGTIEPREVRGDIPWYGTVANHASLVPPAVIAGLVAQALGRGSATHFVDFVAVTTGASVMVLLNLALASLLLAIRTGESFRQMFLADSRTFAGSHLALAPLGWLMARMYATEGQGGWWATLVFALPLYTTRLAYHQYVEMREMFTQTITALAGAVDKRDPFTSKHSWRVKEIAGDIGRVMRLSETDLEALEWGGLLHDVGKIGVRDDVLLKQDKLTREERIEMNSHPVKGAQIIAPVTRLKRELPIIRHHHEWYNGSGYPDRLIGEEIPILARVLHVADAFEAMTAARPYRMTPLSAEIALGELRRYSGVQFDPKVVDAFVKTKWAAGVPDPGRPEAQRQVPLIGQAASETAAKPADTASPSDTKPAD
jgi:putative nucleotidyltransferase with HDIG domain